MEPFNDKKLTRELRRDLHTSCEALGGLIAREDYRAHTRVGLQGKWSDISREEERMLERVQKSMESMLETEMR